MFESLGRSREIAEASYDVLRKEPALVIFPLASIICCGLIAASFFVPAIYLLSPLGFQGIPHESGPLRALLVNQRALVAGAVFIFYLLNYTAVIFFNACIVSCALMRFEGLDPAPSDGVRKALSRLPQILGWALLSATIGVLLKGLERPGGDRNFFVSLTASVLGVAWSLGSLLVLPIIVSEGLGPAAAFAYSSELFRKTWGEELFGHIRIGFRFFLPSLASFALVFIGLYRPSVLSWIAVPAGILGFLYILISRSVMRVIYTSALYSYAKNGKAPAGLEPPAV